MEKAIVIEKTVVGCSECGGSITYCKTCRRSFKLDERIYCHSLEHECEDCKIKLDALRGKSE